MAERTLGDRLVEVFREHDQRLFTSALVITGSPERAEDAVQEAFYRLFRLRAEPRDLKAYVFRSVRNAALDERRRSSSVGTELGDAIFEPGDGPSDTAATRELVQEVTQAMTQLSEDERETIINHLYEDLTFREIAEIREVSINTASSWYRRGIEKLQRQLGDLQ